MVRRPPDEVRTTRLSIRRWNPDDSAALKGAIDSSLAHLQEWMPWAMAEPSALEAIRERLEGFSRNFEDGTEWLYGIFSGDGKDLLGGAGLHPRISATGLEMGYWIRRDKTGLGYATEAAEALARVALTLPGIDHVEIRCDPANGRSAAIPRRLGFAHVETLTRDSVTPSGEPRDTMVWRLTATPVPPPTP